MEKIDLLKERLQKANLQTREYKPQTDGEQESLFKTDGLLVQIPEERDFRSILILDDEEIDTVINSSFEKYRFIKGYEGIWSPELKVAECEIQSNDPYRPSRIILTRLLRFLSKDSDEKRNSITIKYTDNISVTIGESSQEFSILTNFRRDVIVSRGRLFSRSTIRIEGLNVSTHNEAKENLIKISNSIFFPLDMSINIPIHLSIDRELFRELRIARRKIINEEFQLNSTKYEYDQEPMSIYWYARTATNMPLLQYLAFYQVLEFYFPVYSYKEAQQKIRNTIKDPLFSVDNENDLSKIIQIIQSSSKGKTIGDEKSQLNATIQNSIDNDSLKAFIEESEERRDFFDVQKKSKSLAKQNISIKNKDNDIRNEVANRIYEIRCRIVHTKDEAQYELLLPFSPDIVNLKYDLELIEFLARKVLIASSRVLKF